MCYVDAGGPTPTDAEPQPDLIQGRRAATSMVAVGLPPAEGLLFDEDRRARTGPGWRHIGACLGVLAGGMTGAAIGALWGPLGAALAAGAGAVTGGLAGMGAGEAIVAAME